MSWRPEHTQNTYPRRRSQMLAVLLTSLHSGPPLTTPINSVKVNPPNLLVHRWGPGQHTDNWPAPFRPGQWCWAERSSTADAETLNKWTWPLVLGVPPSSFTPACPERWDCVMPRLFPRLGSGRKRERDPWISSSALTESAPFFRPLGKQYPAVPLYFDQPNERCWHFLWSGDCLSIYIKIFMLIRGQPERVFKPG